MKRLAGLLACFLSGCSTAPVADFLDWAFPAQIPPANVEYVGGVGLPPYQPSAPPPPVPIQPVPPPSP